MSTRMLGLVLGCLLPSSTAYVDPCSEVVAEALLSAIQKRDAAALQAIGRNPRVLDAEGLEYLIGTNPFPDGSGLKSASDVLVGRKVYLKVSVSQEEDGSRLVEIVYLPTKTSSSFVKLAQMVEAGNARPFRDFVMCRIIVREGRTYMPHACYAETDGMVGG
jgi:hypothetical protein